MIEFVVDVLMMIGVAVVVALVGASIALLWMAVFDVIDAWKGKG